MRVKQKKSENCKTTNKYYLNLFHVLICIKNKNQYKICLKKA